MHIICTFPSGSREQLQLRFCLHQASASTQSQICGNASNIGFIVFSEITIASVIAALTLTLGVNEP